MVPIAVLFSAPVMRSPSQSPGRPRRRRRRVGQGQVLPGRQQGPQSSGVQQPGTGQHRRHDPGHTHRRRHRPAGPAQRGQTHPIWATASPSPLPSGATRVMSPPPAATSKCSNCVKVPDQPRPHPHPRPGRPPAHRRGRAAHRRRQPAPPQPIDTGAQRRPDHLHHVQSATPTGTPAAGHACAHNHRRRSMHRWTVW
jgi:hypothetical protein